SLPAATHPPFTAWLLGIVVHFFGAGEIPLHLCMFLIAALGLFFAGALGSHFGVSTKSLMLTLGFSPALFLAGALPPIWIAWSSLVIQQKRPRALLTGFGLLLILLLASTWGGFSWLQAILLSFL